MKQMHPLAMIDPGPKAYETLAATKPVVQKRENFGKLLNEKHAPRPAQTEPQKSAAAADKPAAVVQGKPASKASTMGSVPNSCGSCHTVDDSHAGQFADDCLQCHSQQTWRQMTRFDHDLTTFPLIGLHATVACGACHSSNRFHEAKSGCADCHGDNDVHEGALGNACGTCHNSNDWLMTTFDHDLHTRFSLDGSHARLNCVDCHSEAAKSAADVASSCGGCHVMNDAHEGQFGLQCEQCHSTTSFRDVESLGGRKP